MSRNVVGRIVHCNVFPNLPSRLSWAPNHAPHHAHDEPKLHDHGHEHSHDEPIGHDHGPHHAHDEEPAADLTADRLSDAISVLPKEDIYRLKGFVKFGDGIHILNWAFGRSDLTPMVKSDDAKFKGVQVRLTMMGAHGEVKRWARKLAEALQAEVA